MRRGLTVTPRALARYCVTFSDTTELHVSQSVKDSNTSRYQKVPGEYGHHHMWVVYDKLDVGGVSSLSGLQRLASGKLGTGENT